MPRVRIGRSKSRRKSARRTVIKLLKELPNMVRLLLGLIADARVSKIDKLLFGAVMAYVVLPIDLLPDFMGPLGFADDLYLIGLSLSRLFSHAGPDILLEHWHGHPRALGYLIEGVEEVGTLLPEKVKSALKGFV
jgi:uncharacterized membrane protein YkvA (DUF1232 family)